MVVSCGVTAWTGRFSASYQVLPANRSWLPDGTSPAAVAAASSCAAEVSAASGVQSTVW